MTQFKIEPPVIAHRGASAYAPENTLAAFKKARDLGVSWVELDVMLAACGELIVFHDETLDRLSAVKGSVSEFTFEALQKIDVGSWFDPQFSAERIPTLKQVLEFLQQNNMAVNIELKPLPGQEQELAQKVLGLLAQVWPSYLPAPLLSSFSVEALQALRANSAACGLGLLMEELFPNWQSIQKTLQCVSLNINQAVINAESIKILQSAQLPLLSYTVNNPWRARELFSLGVSAFFTDCPDRILEVIFLQ